MAADQAKFLKEKERATRRKAGLRKPSAMHFAQIAERLRKQDACQYARASETPVSETSSIEPVEPTPPVKTRSEPIQPDETALLANLPVPVIIHSGDAIHYVNQALLDITGYESLDDIRSAGGVDVLFNGESDDGETRQSMLLRHADGSENRSMPI